MLQQRWALPVAQPQRPGAAAEVFEEAWQQHKTISSANQNSMLIVFLAYPMLSSTIFSVFACRELDFGQSIHIYDAQIDCNSETYRSMFYLAIVLVLMILIGVPAAFGLLLWVNRARLDPPLPATQMTFSMFHDVVEKILADKIPPTTLRKLYDQMDTDGSGLVDQSEVWRWTILREFGGHRLLDGGGGLSAAEPPVLVEEEGGAATPASATSDLARGRRWWEGGPDDFK